MFGMRWIRDKMSVRDFLEEYDTFKIILIVLFFVGCIFCSYAGYSVGSENKTEKAYDDGFEAGYDEGYQNGYDYGKERGNIEGFDAGLISAESVIDESSYQEGFENGYNAGWEEACDEYGIEE